MCRIGILGFFFAAALCFVSGNPMVKVSASNDCDDSYRCSAGQTCCKSEVAASGYGCCEGIDAVCCSDGIHCCPSGTTCNLAAGNCVQMAVQKMNYLKRATTSLVAAKKAGPILAQSTNTICPIIGGDSHRYECPSFNTCCIRSDGKYGCCPYQNAVCCADGMHCCPENRICGPGGTCQRKNLSFKRTSGKKL